MFSIEVLPDGNLKVKAGNDARRWIKEEQQDDRSSDSILWDGTERYWTNGSFEPFDAGQANPFVGLTCAPCIAEALHCRDHGDREIVGGFWYFERYQLVDLVEVLKRTGHVIFSRAR
jgi:hypothetical protein